MNRIFFAALLPIAMMIGCADEGDTSTETNEPATAQVEAAAAEADQVSEQRKPKCTPSANGDGSTICCTPISCVEF